MSFNLKKDPGLFLRLFVFMTTRIIKKKLGTMPTFIKISNSGILGLLGSLIS